MANYPPTEQRREELRDSGVFPRSRDLDVMGLFFGFFLACFFLRGFSLLEEYSIERLLGVLLVVPLATACGVVVSTLIQSRFLVKFSSNEAQPESVTYRAVFAVAKALIWIGAFYLLLQYLLKSQFSLEELAHLLLRFLGLALIPLLFLGIVGRFVVGLLFSARYAMTKEEILAEARDSEIRPEFRQARAQ